MTAWLVVGYGNTLRSDDGAGPWVARAVAEWGLPGVRALALHQLTPESAAELKTAVRVLFVDASIAPRRTLVGLSRLRPLPATAVPGHTSHPSGLLALALALYGSCPPAWLLTVPATNLDFGEGFSEETRRGCEEALAWIARLLRERSARDF